MIARIRANARALNPQFVLPALVVGGAACGLLAGIVADVLRDWTNQLDDIAAAFADLTGEDEE